MQNRIVVLISGSGTNLQAIVDACKSPDFPGTVVAVLSNKADAYGITRANNENIPSHIIAHQNFANREAYDQELMTIIDSYQADLVVLAGFMRILTPAFVQHFQGKLINIHPSLLPKYQGLNTHQRAIDAKDKEHGASVHFVTEELDGGPVILQAKVPIFENDTSDTLAKRIHKQEHIIYPKVVKWFGLQRIKMINERAYMDGVALPACGYTGD